MRKITANPNKSIVFCVAALIFVGAASSAPQAKSKAAKAVASTTPIFGNSDSITEEELKVYLYFLASDQMEGRNLPSRGYDIAALYVASHLAEWGLKPGGSTTNTNGPLQPYLMPIELVGKQVIPAESISSITAPAPAGGRGGRGGGAGGGGRGRGGADGAATTPAPRTTEFEYGKDWTLGGGGGRGGAPVDALDLTGNLVFAGNGYSVKKGDVNPYAGLDVKGKIVVVAGLPPELAAQQAAAGAGGRGGGGAAPVNPLGESCTDFMTPEQSAAKNGAIAVITIPNFQTLTALANPNAGGGRGGALNGPAYRVPKLVQPPACPVVPALSANLALINAIFQGEKKTASQIFYGSEGDKKQESFELTKEKTFHVKVSVHTDTNHGENVVGILEGSDPVLKNEYIVISAHLDHLGLSAPQPDGHNVNNGADDDGSGSAGLLAVAHSYAEGAAKGVRPRRSIIFLWNAGEEKGLWGSQYYAEFPPVDISKIVSDLNMDMIGRTQGSGYSDPDPTHVLVKPGELLLVGPNISSDDLGKTVDGVNAKYMKLTMNHFYDTTAPDATHDNLGPQPRGQRIFYRSDHYNFAKMGIPIAFFTVGLHPDYHRTTDTPDKIDYKEMQVVSKTVSAVAWVLGTQDGRPQLNAKLPEQLLKDMKSAKDQKWGTLTPVLPPLPGMPF